jgi:hypothetical protein
MWGQEELDRMEKEYQESGQREKDIFDKFLTYVYKYNDEPRNTSRGIENKLGELYIHKEIYGTEGGTCWDQNNTREFMVNEEKIVKTIVSSVEGIIEAELKDLNLDQSKVKEWMDSNVHSKSRFSYIKDYFVPEYYGNSTTYGIFKIDFNNLIEHACSDREKQLYKEAQAEFTPPIKYKNSWGR